MHPGELLREEILPALDRPKTEIAGLLGVSRQTLYDVLNEKQPVTPGMALRLGKLCGNGPDLWLNLQKRYDLHLAQQELGEKIKKFRRCKSPDQRLGRFAPAMKEVRPSAPLHLVRREKHPRRAADHFARCARPRAPALPGTRTA